jgi:peptidoglycan/xylan/chitin deacetylase (PgdA/CDA1 family)
MNQAGGSEERQIPMEWFEFAETGVGGVRVEYSDMLREVLGDNFESIRLGLQAEAHFTYGYPSMEKLAEYRSEIERAKQLFEQETGFRWDEVESMRVRLGREASSDDNLVGYLRGLGVGEILRDGEGQFSPAPGYTTAVKELRRRVLGD